MFEGTDKAEIISESTSAAITINMMMPNPAMILTANRINHIKIFEMHRKRNHKIRNASRTDDTTWRALGAVILAVMIPLLILVVLAAFLFIAYSEITSLPAAGF